MEFAGVQGTTEKNYSLEKLLKQSNYTLVYFYPKDNTPGCTVQASDFTTHAVEFKNLNIQVIGVSKDSIKSHCNFIEKHGLSPLYLSDPELTLHKQFGAWGEKNNYGKKVEGVIRSTVLLDQTGAVIKQRNNVRAKGHVERLIKEIKELSL